jgi:hypothetical protein
MKKKAHSVALVLDRDFGQRLAPLATRMHVWIVNTPENVSAARVVRDEGGLGTAYSLERQVTTFDAILSDPPDKIAVDILDTIDEHHSEFSHMPPWSILEVYGAQPTAAFLNALAELRFSSPEDIDGGFRIGRVVPEDRAG